MEAMMECDRVQELLPFIDDGSLEQDIVKTVKAHMEKCLTCQKEYNEIIHVVNLMNSVLTQHVPEHSQSFLYVLQKKINAKKRERKVYQLMLPAAAVVILTVSIALYSIHTKQVPDSLPFQIVRMAEQDNELYNYIAEQYLDTYELFELVYNVETVDEYDLRDALFQHEYFNVTADDIFDTLDEIELYNFFVSLYN